MNEIEKAAETPFCREEKLIGSDAFQRLKDAHVAVFGLGGVGSYAAEALARGGIGRLSLIDSDRVSVSNLNRQLYALTSTIGCKKTEAAALRCLDINPGLSDRIGLFDRFVLPENTEVLFSELQKEQPLDFVLDAVDTVAAKIALAVYCEAHDIPLISCCGTGNKLDPGRFEISDIYKTSVCPLCRVLRKELKERGVKKLSVCWSKEVPVKTESRTPASISFVPGAAGLMIAGYAIRKIAGLD
ncbi:MAG: tRNA threonylcarbamoyladenosine dehydratase [Eubacteriales bacterium]|nr:tRNA threonylcarbamoyladenosine dehydratase [Eubacteriales bacterium]